MTECPSCGEVSSQSYRCEHCGRDLVDERDDQDDVATDGGQDWAWIVESPTGERQVAGTMFANAVAELLEDDEIEHHELRIATWSEREAVAADGGTTPADAEQSAPVLCPDGGVEPGYYVVDEAAGVVLEGPRERHRDAVREVTDERQVVVHSDQLDTLDVEDLRWGAAAGQTTLTARGENA